MFIRSLLLFLLIYSFARNTNLDKNIRIYVIGIVLMVLCGITKEIIVFLNMDYWYYNFLIYGFQGLIISTYLIFYNNDVFIEQLRWFVPLVLSYIFIVLYKPYVGGGIIFAFICLWIILLFHKNVTKRTFVPLILMSLSMIFVEASNSLLIAIVMMVIAFDQYASSKESESYRNMELFQRKLLSHQYAEIKDIYMNMRGWRHDYHNHLQTMKAYLSMNELKELDEYLFKVEKDLDAVDNLVKSGNVMMDAILNSKISIMKRNNIEVDFKAVLPEDLKINDVDLCVMVSNLLENAIEACIQVPVEGRFIRIYADVYGSQFYISIQNSSKENLDFNARNYISNKRGEHGFGMKRVQLLVDKYNGFLNLQNEPGIFASEITIPF
ncbi:signal transduction histidine kinase regulating citrate/malate metabolism [Clostridium putrefaciens]|uniref:Signal transduction histidine kinase regulating citrate/malate metabolism n=1 Tax=Clostridium putrefaciens TaxID=99675 RepID=A0A381J5W5_9CLOT|nr:sensor histidine kinase [Clostridium putrefaciens]SUY46525.1 signal transduction histidine kinase regulating citrate/malate metabolism [Clostridium putrefaciens]